MDEIEKVLRDGAGDGVIELLREGRVGRLPRAEGLFPFAVGGGKLRVMGGEIRLRRVGDKEMLFWESETFSRGFGELGPAFAMPGSGSGDLGDALADDRFGLDQLGFAVAIAFRSGDGGVEGV